ncbi:hypothetical protein M1N52_03150 [Thermodesulfovibrionales bacterium]|nr:hypothetical protein [Thermodesulfovibrionales bacterium]
MGKSEREACLEFWDDKTADRDGVAEIMNIQPLRDGQAKAYQVKQIRSIILRYKLHKEVNDV